MKRILKKIKFKHIKKNFFTGLLLILPFTLTVLIVAWTINLLTNPFQGSMEKVLSYYGLFNSSFWYLSASQVLFLVSKIFVIVILAVALLLIGFFAQMFLLNALITFGEMIVAYIPFFNKIYKMIKDIVDTLFQPKGNSFAQVVLVQFPCPGSYTMGLVTMEEKMKLPCKNISVFVPGAPNPTFGFMMTCEHKNIIYLDMKVEEGLKFILSCGMINKPFKIKFDSSE